MILAGTPQSCAAVAAHYDELDPFYREVWGEHVHHGYWATGRETPERAVEALVDLVADRLDLAPGHSVCDIGCGYGATAQILAERHKVHVTGVTVASTQAAAAGLRTPTAGTLAIHRVDWLANGLPAMSYDRAYAIESSEHMADKGRFFAEAHRVLRPGGRLVVCAWLSRHGPRPWEVRWLLEPICREARLPGMGEQQEYLRFAEGVGFTTVAAEDLSDRVSRTWSICARRVVGKLATDPRYLRYLLDRRATDRAFALSLARLLVAYRTGSMRYGLMVFDRPR